MKDSHRWGQGLLSSLQRMHQEHHKMDQQSHGKRLQESPGYDQKLPLGTLTQAWCTQGQSPNPLWLLHCYLSLEAGFSKGHWPPGSCFCLRPEKTLWRVKKFLPLLPVLKIVSHGARSVGTVWAMSACRLLPKDLWQESGRFPVLCTSQLTPGKWVG